MTILAGQYINKFGSHCEMEEALPSCLKAYELDLDNKKKNVFVTQLHDRKEEDDIKAFPIVKETGLIKTGINTSQWTLLLKKEVEMKDRVSKFEGFLKENELKRQRTIQKYQTEVQLKEQKTKELEELEDELENLKDVLSRLEKKVSHYKKFEDYLLFVIDIMPEDYLAASDDKKGLMSCHRMMQDSNTHLLNRLEFMSDERTELGVILMAIDSIAEICHKRLDILVQDITLDQKLNRIKDYVSDRADVAIVACFKEQDESQTGSEKGSIHNLKSSKITDTKRSYNADKLLYQWIESWVNSE